LDPRYGEVGHKVAKWALRGDPMLLPSFFVDVSTRRGKRSAQRSNKGVKVPPGPKRYTMKNKFLKASRAYAAFRFVPRYKHTYIPKYVCRYNQTLS
jgi:hypothetical protein